MAASAGARSGWWMLSWARFGSSFFWEGPVLTASAEARSDSWMTWARFNSSFFLEGARLYCFGRGPLQQLDIVDLFRQQFLFGRDPS